jgi:hypothetical protein
MSDLSAFLPYLFDRVTCEPTSVARLSPSFREQDGVPQHCIGPVILGARPDNFGFKFVPVGMSIVSGNSLHALRFQTAR